MSRRLGTPVSRPARAVLRTAHGATLTCPVALARGPEGRNGACDGRVRRMEPHRPRPQKRRRRKRLFTTLLKMDPNRNWNPTSIR